MHIDNYNSLETDNQNTENFYMTNTRIFFGLLGVFFGISTTSMAAGLPVCIDGKEGFGPDNTPCLVSENEIGGAVIDMLLANRKGYHWALDRKYANGLMRSAFGKTGNLRVTNLGHVNEAKAPHLLVTKVRYELLLTDCQGTDACGASYVWTVNETTKSDGFNYDVSYSNNLDVDSAFDLPVQN